MILALIPLVMGLLGGAIYGVWLSAEEAKAERQQLRKRELDAALDLTHELGQHGPKGFDRQRRMS